MRIAIVGAGAMRGAFGARLTLRELVTHTKEHLLHRRAHRGSGERTERASEHSHASACEGSCQVRSVLDEPYGAFPPVALAVTFVSQESRQLRKRGGVGPRRPRGRLRRWPERTAAAARRPRPRIP